MVQDRVIERVVHGLRWNALLELGIGIRNEGGGFAANIYCGEAATTLNPST